MSKEPKEAKQVNNPLTGALKIMQIKEAEASCRLDGDTQSRQPVFVDGATLMDCSKCKVHIQQELIEEKRDGDALVNFIKEHCCRLDYDNRWLKFNFTNKKWTLRASHTRSGKPTETIYSGDSLVQALDILSGKT